MEAPKGPNSPQSIVFANEVLEVLTCPVVTADGLEIPEYLVVKPRHCPEDLVTGAAVLATVDGNIALLTIYRPALGRAVLEIPRGFRDPGETPLEAAVRELREETGLHCPCELEPLGEIYPESGVLRAKIALFLAPDCTREAGFEATETGHRGMELLSPAEMARRVDRCEILDPATLVAWYRVADRLRIQPGQPTKNTRSR